MSQKFITTLDLMRHGEPVGGRKYRGQMDDPLSETGWSQMQQAVSDRCLWHAVISSPLSRCADFAKKLAGRHGLKLEIDARLTELGFGAWEGRNAAELTTQDPDCLIKFRADPITHAPLGAESLTKFRLRVLEAWNAMLETYRGRQVLVVVHAGVIRMVVAHVLDIPIQNLFRLRLFHASLTRITVETNGNDVFPQLIFLDGRI